MKLLSGLIVLMLAVLIGAIGGGVTVLSQGLPEVMALEQYRPPSSTVIYAADSSVLAEFAVEKRTPVELDEMPKILIRSVLAIEDHRYFEHIGINVGRILKALLVDIIAMEKRQGGSTITQQLAKVLYLSPEKTIERKIREAILAFQIEKLYTKNEILTFYLNQIYLGNGAYGVGAASKAYFDKDVGELSLADAALLAGLPKNPSRYNPFRHPEYAKARRDTVIKRLLVLGWVTGEEATEAIAQPVPEKPAEKPPAAAPYFVEAVRRELVEMLGHEQTYKGGLHVYTTLDPLLQSSAEKAVAKGIESVDSRFHEEDSPIQAALVAMDPVTGAVQAHVGGANWKESSFDRSYQALRQVGSTFKPFVYIAALENGASQADTVLDAPAKYQGARRGEFWEPQNYDKKFKGLLTYRRALALSRNLPAVKVLEKYGMASVESVVTRLGMKSSMGQGLASALGVGSSSLYQITAAYAALPTGGMRPEPYRIRAVIDPGGENIWEQPTPPRRALSPETAYVASDMLRSVIEDGTGKRARALPFPVGGKTGTTDDQRDASFIGFSSRLALGVWVGRDDNTPIGRGMTGSVAALPIWVDVMLASSANGTPKPWPVPREITFAEIDLVSGGLAGQDCELTSFAAFAQGSKPTEPCKREKFTWQELSSYYKYETPPSEIPAFTMPTLKYREQLPDEDN